jgi:hypothetical protein
VVSSGSREDAETVGLKYGNETLGSIKEEKFLEELNDY